MTGVATTPSKQRPTPIFAFWCENTPVKTASKPVKTASKPVNFGEQASKNDEQASKKGVEASKNISQTSLLH